MDERPRQSCDGAVPSSLDRLEHPDFRHCPFRDDSKKIFSGLTSPTLGSLAPLCRLDSIYSGCIHSGVGSADRLRCFSSDVGVCVAAHLPPDESSFKIQLIKSHGYLQLLATTSLSVPRRSQS